MKNNADKADACRLIQHLQKKNNQMVTPFNELVEQPEKQLRETAYELSKAEPTMAAYAASIFPGAR